MALTHLRNSLVISALASLFLATSTSTFAQTADYPNRTVRLIVPFAPGGTTDGVGRLIASELSSRLGQAVIVENRPGAGSQVGTASAAKAEPDGYTLLLGNIGGMAIIPELQVRAPYDPIKDFTPVSQVASAPLIFAAHADVPFDSMEELMTQAKARPGQITYGSAGIGSLLHLGVELLQSNSDTEMLHVPYQGGGPMMQALISGEVDFVLTTPDFTKRYVDSGHVKALAQADAERHPLLPEVPTTDELGMANLYAVSWFGVVGPAGLPKAVVERLDNELAAIVQDPIVAEKLVQLGAQATYRDPAAFAQYIAAEQQRWAQTIQAANIPLQEN